jgi:thiol:disulfide interchange protein
MIPINIAIIGAGAQAGSKKRGFALGATYAAGMALAYGILGLVVVLTGSKFGTLNSSPWFNLAIATVFVVLALGMFDVLAIDLSRFQGQGSGGGASSKGKFFAAYSMGTVAALLAGACVAPVVISVLLQATTFYNKGIIAGLFLPFLLGLGMGLPWPFAGAGLSFLPKPGRWMARVKHGFGVFIILFALYYGHLAVSLFQTSGDLITASAKGRTDVTAAQAALSEQLARGLAEARASGQPVFIDFWASWCKNCSAMEHTTFESSIVKERLAGFRQVRLQTERLNHPLTREVLDYFKVLGLPSFVVLTPAPATPSAAGSPPANAALAP